MKKEDFPKEATSDNVTDLMEKVQEITNMIPRWAREKSVRRFFVENVLDIIVFTSFLNLINLAFGGLLLLVLYFFNISPFTPIRASYFYPMVAVVLLMSIVSTYLSFRLKKRFYLWLYYRLLHFPRSEFKIFSRGALLAQNLLDGNKRLAKRFIRPFGVAVKEYLDENKDLKNTLIPKPEIFRVIICLGE